MTIFLKVLYIFTLFLSNNVYMIYIYIILGIIQIRKKIII